MNKWDIAHLDGETPIESFENFLKSIEETDISDFPIDVQEKIKLKLNKDKKRLKIMKLKNFFKLKK